MLTDISLRFILADSHQDFDILIADNQQNYPILPVVAGGLTATNKILLPNQLKITLIDKNPRSSKSIMLENMSLGGIKVESSTLDQCCQFFPMGGDKSIFTRHWHCAGTVVLDLFAKDWVQFHLLYGHKILY